jgi:hypothetical protein
VPRGPAARTRDQVGHGQRLVLGIGSRRRALAVFGHVAVERIDHPHDDRTSLEIVLCLAFQRSQGVVLAAHLDEQFGDRIQVAFRRAADRQPHVRDEGGIGAIHVIGVARQHDRHVTAASLAVPAQFPWPFR